MCFFPKSAWGAGRRAVMSAGSANWACGKRNRFALTAAGLPVTGQDMLTAGSLGAWRG